MWPIVAAVVAWCSLNAGTIIETGFEIAHIAHLVHLAIEVNHIVQESLCPHGHISTIFDLDEHLGGDRVVKTVPLGEPCFSAYNGFPIPANEALCREVQDNYHDDAFRERFPGSYASDISSICLASTRNQCQLSADNPYDDSVYSSSSSDGGAAACMQGSVPRESIDVRGRCDVSVPFSHSKKTGRALVIKNSGLDYNGRSSHQGALMLRTREMRQISHEVDEAGRGRLRVGAGVSCGEAYEYAFKHNYTVICASSPTVGMAGGWVLDGGHSVLSNKFGLGADRVIEYRTFDLTDRDERRIFKHQFRTREVLWALSGGGAGGAFGVVLESLHEMEPLFPIVIADISFESRGINDTLDWVRLLAEEAVPWSKAGWGGHVRGTSMVYVNAMQNVSDAEVMLRRVTEFALARNGSSSITGHASFEAYYRKYIEPNTHNSGRSGLVTSRLIGSDDISVKEGQDQMVAYFDELLRSGDGEVRIDATTPVNHKREYHPSWDFQSTVNNGSYSPGWRKSVWHVASTIPFRANFTLDERKMAVKKLNRYTRLLKEISPNTGTYVGEASMFNKDWREDYWGKENYERMLKVRKQRMSKKEMFNLVPCVRCIGWDESMASDCTKEFEDLGEP